MSRAVTFTQADVQRAIKATKAAGCEVTGVVITRDGEIRILTEAKAAEQAGGSALEAWRRKRGQSAA